MDVSVLMFRILPYHHLQFANAGADAAICLGQSVNLLQAED